MVDMVMTDWVTITSILTAVITAIGTGALALYAYRSFETVKTQMDLLKKQALSMEKQSNLMAENIEYDRLTRKYKRLNVEIRELFEPLIAKKDDYLVFESAGTYGSSSPYGKEHEIFWNNIKIKMYLADKALYAELQNYFTSMENYRKTPINGYCEHTNDDKIKFKAEKDKLIRQIESSFKNLQEEIHKTELELKM